MNLYAETNSMDTDHKLNIEGMCSNCRLCSLVGRELICLQNSKSGISAPTELQEINNHNSDSRYQNSKAASHDAHFTQIIRQELLYFCENTTIRGLPRIVRASSRPLRLLWSTLVCSLVIGCAMCLFFLSRQYLEYNVIHPPRVLRHTSSPFPSVTVCNLRPISPDGLRYLKTHGLKTPRQFATNLADYTKYLYFNSHRKEEYFAASAAFSLAGFLESLPNDEVRRNLGYLYDKLVIKCQMTYLNGSKPVATPCDEGGRWRKFIHAQYLNCATFEPFVELRASTTNIEMYIYLNEMSDHATCPDCFRGEVKSQLSGALIVIDSADHLPNVNDKSINLKPGSLTEIRLSIIENVQKQPPHGRCSPNLPKSLPLYDTSYAYSEYACRQYTIQNDINQKCGCYSLEYPYNEHDGFEPCSRLPTFVNLTSCSTEKIARSNVRPSVSDSSITDMCTQEIELFTKRMLCKRSVMENYVHGALPSCTMPCAFYSYEAEQSTSSWPTKTWQLTWLNSSSNRRLGIFQGPEFEVYREAQRLLASGNETGAAHLLDNANVLERNLLAVLINRPNFDVRKVEEKEVLSLTSLLSQSGGLFSIWLGLSMIALGEIAEFLVRCYTKTMENRQAKCTSKHQTEPSELNDRKIAFGNHRTDEWKNQLLAAEKWPVRCSENHFLWILLLNYIKAKSEHKENSLCMIQTQYQEIKCEDFGVRGNHQLFPGDDAQQKQQGQRDYSCEF